MGKSLIAFLFCLLLSAYTFAQQGTPPPATPAAEIDEDELMSNGKIMIIPHNPSAHRTDVEERITDQKLTEGKAEEARTWSNFGLNENVSPRIISLNQEKKALNDFTTQSDNDFSWIYASIDYKYEKRNKQNAQKNGAVMDNLMGKFKSGKGKDLNVSREYESDMKHKEFMNAVIEDPSLLPNLSEKYGVQLFVFINQVEIFTNYKKYLDEDNKIYERQIKVHYSVYDKEGGELFGDLAIVNFYPNMTKDIDQLIMERFPIVSNFISTAFPDSKLADPSESN